MLTTFTTTAIIINISGAIAEQSERVYVLDSWSGSRVQIPLGELNPLAVSQTCLVPKESLLSKQELNLFVPSGLRQKGVRGCSTVKIAN